MESKKLHLLYAQVYFISIATILGTGILGLPVTLYKAGFFPFIFTFTLAYIMQVFVIYLMTEVLQYCKAVLSEQGSARFSLLENSTEEVLLIKQKKKNKEEHLMFDITRTPDNQDDQPGSEANGKVASSDSSEDEDLPGETGPNYGTMDPNLHIIGKLFLHKYVQAIFMIILFMNFIATIISYALAGSEAYGQILSIQYTKIIPVFTWVLTLLIITSREWIRPVIATMTLVKGSLLFATVVVTIYTGAAVNHHIVDDWRALDKPFLMGIVALGGVPLVMPMLFGKFEAVGDQMKGFRNALVGGMTTCFILNIMWCWAVLKVVPQSYDTCRVLGSSPQPQNSTAETLSTTIGTSATSVKGPTCDPETTLEWANEAGEISTVPLTKIIESDYKDLKWIAIMVQVFMVISITVSFLTVGSAMQHTISGWVDSVVARWGNCKLTGSFHSFFPENWFWHYLFGLAAFAIVFIVAIMDPKGFVSILEKLASFATNCTSGLITFLLIRAVRSRQYRHIRISLPTHRFLKNIHYVTLVYFTVGVAYDIVISIMNIKR